MKNFLLPLLLLLLLFPGCKLNNSANDTDFIEYYSDGSIKSQSPVKNGKRNGIVRNYSDKGKLLSTAEYVDDLREGWVINYSSENYKPMLKAYFKKDTQNGPVIQYYKEGMLFRESNYLKGRIDGIVKTYWPNGKIKAENFYKMGKPLIGLKEYTQDGKFITDEPYIVVKEINQMALLDKVIVQIKLSEYLDDVEFYLDELEDGKYLPARAFKLSPENGVVTMEYPVARGGAYIKKLSIIAKAKSKLGNTLILHKDYPLKLFNIY